jgi:diguanylate cyclase (GGDEF)-like protein
MFDFEPWKGEFRATHPAHTCVDRPHVYCEACRATLVSAPPAPLWVSIPAPSEQSPVAPDPSESSVLPQISHEDCDLLPNVDLLTSLQSKSAFLREIETAKQAKTIAFIEADLDKFHALNIAHGHEVGDELLRVIGDIFWRSCRPLRNRCVGPSRFGGESFAFALLDMDEAAAGLAEGIREWISTLRPRVTARFVVVTGVSEIVDMLRLAHSVLYPHPDLKVPNSVTSRSKAEFPDDKKPYIYWDEEDFRNR